MVSLSTKVETGHRDVIHDAVMNYHGTRLATCSGDHAVKIFEVRENGQNFPLAELNGHEGPVWQVSWSSPKSGKGEHLASCSYDKKVLIWKEVDGKWQRVHEYGQHDAGVNSVSWAPPEYGLLFACCSTDCTISIVQKLDEAWKAAKIYKAHDQGVNAVSWCPALLSASDPNNAVDVLPKRIATGGNDKRVKIWREDSDANWILEGELEGHTDWVRDVAWSPVEAHGNFTIASCGLDGLVIIWRTNNLSTKNWQAHVIRQADEPVYNVMWSPNGTVLAVATATGKATLYQERIQNEWVQISDAVDSLE